MDSDRSWIERRKGAAQRGTWMRERTLWVRRSHLDAQLAGDGDGCEGGEGGHTLALRQPSQGLPPHLALDHTSLGRPHPTATPAAAAPGWLPRPCE